MLKDHYQNSPTDPPTAQSLILAEAEALLSFWPNVRDDDSLGPEEAFNLLSVWGHLRRFAPISIDSELTDRFNRLIKEELEVICGRAMEIEFPVDWIDTSIELEEAWDHVTNEDLIYAIERCVREQFKILDRASLMAYSIKQLQSFIVSDQRFIAMTDSIGAAEDFLADRPDVFLSAAVYASAMLDSYRVDLHAFDEDLAETSLKHRILQGLIDEQQAPLKPVVLPHEVTDKLVRILASNGENSRVSTYVLEAQPTCQTRESTLSITAYIVELPRAFNFVRNEFLHGQAASPMRESPCESRRYAIMGDPESSARVSLEIDSSDRTRDVIFVELIRSSLAYTAVSVHFSDGTSTAMEFDGQTGRLSVIAGINSFQIKLVDVSGGEHILTPKEV